MVRAAPSTSSGTSSWGGFKIELVAVVGYTLLVVLAILLGLVGGPLRILLASPVLGFLPGYALVSALFPGDDGDDEPTVTAARLRRPGLTWFERCALAVAGSLALLPLIALGLSVLSAPMELPAFLLSLTLIIVLGMAVGVFRRSSLPVEQRYALPLDRWNREVTGGTVGSEKPLDAVLNTALVIAVVLALSGLAFGLAAPDRGESFSEVALLTEQNNSLVAGGYPESVVAGEQETLTLSVENQQGRTQRYSVVVLIERVRSDGQGLTVLQQEELNRFSMRLEDGSHVNRRFTVAPEMLGTDLRLDVLVFEGSAPSNPSPARADHQLYLWLDVREPTANTSVVRPVGWT